MCDKSLQSCLTLGNHMDCSPPSSPVHGDSPGKNTGVDCMPSFRGPSQPRTEPMSLMCPALAGGFFTPSTTWEAQNESCFIPYA